jgi:hypothetical protein
MSGSGPPLASTPATIQADTVEALVDTVRSLLRDEDAREQSITGRAVGLSGFSGLILSLAGPVSASSVRTETLAVSWRYAVTTLLVASLAALLVTILTAIFGVLRPREFATIAMSEVARYPLPEYVERPRVMVQGTTLRGLVDALATERHKNSRKANALGLAYLSLAAGLTGVSALAGILGFHSAGLI